MRRVLGTFFYDPLLLVITSQSLFLAYGISFLNFNLSLLDIAASVIAAVTAELLLWCYVSKRFGGLTLPKSAVAAALGICLFFRASHPLLFAACAVVAIASKYILRWNGRHIFNPSNIAILICAFGLPYFTTVELTQWGNDPYLYSIVAAVTLFVSYRAGALLTTLSFFAAYITILIPSVAYFPHIFAAHHLGLIGPSLLLFASYMITDPRTSPQTSLGRIIHGASVAALYFALEAFGVPYSIFLASFGVAACNATFNMLLSRLLERHRIPNVLSVVCIVCITTVAYGTIWKNVGGDGFTLPSTKFLLFGIESGVIAACGNTTFETRTDVGLPYGRRASTSHVSWGDYDNDGHDDLLVILNSKVYLYRNDGTLFSDVTKLLDLPNMQFTAAYFADYDNDYRLDIFVSSVDELMLYRNDQGRYTDITKLSFPSGADGARNMTFADLDADGDLDIVTSQIGRRAELLPQRNVALKKHVTDPVGRSVAGLTCNPDTMQEIFRLHPDIDYAAKNNPDIDWTGDRCLQVISKVDLSEDNATFPSINHILEVMLIQPGNLHLYENDRGVFVEKTEFSQTVRAVLDRSKEEVGLPLFAGLHPYSFIGSTFFQPITFDYDSDGRLDIFIAIDNGANLLLRNRGSLHFEDVTSAAEIDYLGSGMGTDVADYDRDGDFDIVVSNVHRDFLFANNNDGTFSNVDMPDFGSIGLGWGIVFLDYNGDGWEDVFIANGDMKGHYEYRDSRYSRPLFRRDNVYFNKGDGTFVDRTSNTLCEEFLSGYAAAVSDYDADGDPDVVVGNLYVDDTMMSGVVLYENRNSPKNFVRLNLRGERDNSFGIGAIVSVRDGHATSHQLVTSGSGFRGQESTTLLFAVSDASKSVDISVHWPSGDVTTREGVQTNKTITIHQ